MWNLASIAETAAPSRQRNFARCVGRKPGCIRRVCLNFYMNLLDIMSRWRASFGAASPACCSVLACLQINTWRAAANDMSSRFGSIFSFSLIFFAVRSSTTLKWLLLMIFHCLSLLLGVLIVLGLGVVSSH